MPAVTVTSFPPIIDFSERSENSEVPPVVSLTAASVAGEWLLAYDLLAFVSSALCRPRFVKGYSSV